MKRMVIPAVLSAAVLAGALTLPAGASALKASDIYAISALTNTARTNECEISVKNGSLLEFSASDLERRLSMERGALSGITLTALPDAGEGYFVLDGVEVALYEFIARKDIDRLCFVHGEGSDTARASILPMGDDAKAAALVIAVTGSVNLPPVVESARYSTIKNLPLQSSLRASDPEGDRLELRVVKKPARGDVTLNGLSFTYEPFPGVTGADYFVVCAIDSAGNFSEDAKIEINIEKSYGFKGYVDMAGNPSAYAALKLREAGVMKGREIGGEHFFYPKRQVTSADFLVMLLSAHGYTENLAACVNTELPGDSRLPMWLKPYVAKAVAEGILPRNIEFDPGAVPSRAYAVYLTHRASKIDDVKDFNHGIPDAGLIPDYARNAYRDLAAYRMLDLHSGYAMPQSALTNDYAADLIWQLWKLEND